MIIFRGAIFVFTDETWVEIGGVRREQKVSRPRRANPYDYCRPKKRTAIRVMFWGSIAYGYKGPYHIWTKETKEEKDYFDTMVAKERQVNREIVDSCRNNALIPGTEENRILQEIHNEVVNGPRTATGRQRPRPPPQWIWKYDKTIKRQSTEGGIDWIRYREIVLYPLIYPFLRLIKMDNPNQEIWLVEDNAPPHSGSVNHDSRWIAEMDPLGIHRCNWPPNSPDLNKIEPLWDDYKDLIQTEGPFTGKSIDPTIIRELMVKDWGKLSIETINNRCADFRYKLELVVRNQGRNNFHG